MKRHVLAGLMGMALAGCVQNRWELPQKYRVPQDTGPGPVGMEPVPPIHATINRGTGPVDPEADPWSGPPSANLVQGPHIGIGSSATAPTPRPLELEVVDADEMTAAPPPPDAVAASEPAPGRPAPFAHQVPSAPRPQATAPGNAPAMVQAYPPTPDRTLGSPPGPGQPTNAPPSGSEMGAVHDGRVAILARSNLETDPTGPDPSVAAWPDAVPDPDRIAEPFGGVPRVAFDDEASRPDPSLGARPDAMPVPALAASETGDEAASPVPEHPDLGRPDPSIGARPDAVPLSLIDLPASPDPAAPADSEFEPLPEPEPVNEPLPEMPPPFAPHGALVDVDSASGLPASDAPAPRPAPAINARDPAEIREPSGLPDFPTGDDFETQAPEPLPLEPLDEVEPLPTFDLPPLDLDGPVPVIEPLPEDPEAPVSQNRTGRTAPDIPARAPAADSAVRSVAAPGGDPQAEAPGSDPTTARMHLTTRGLPSAALAAARVGDEIITLRELRDAVRERQRNLPHGYQMPPEVLNRLASAELDRLIRRTLFVQEARRLLGNPQHLDEFHRFVDRLWEEKGLPPLLHRTGASNVHGVRDRLADQGESLDAIRDSFRLDVLEQLYIQKVLGPRIKVDLPAMLAYYNTHKNDFHRPAEVTWREVVVRVTADTDPAQARRQAEALWNRLRRGEEFAPLAQAHSQGATADQGGLWTTAPGSFAVPAVNQALMTLPLNQISPILEGPQSFHIIRVEKRRNAGPATFAEVQDQIHTILFEQTVEREVEALLDRLRSRTLITTMFDGTASAPSLSQPSATAQR